MPNRDSRAPEPWPLLPALGGLALCWLLLGWPWLSGRVTIPWDAKAHFYPQIVFLAQSLARGESPAWAPFVFSGHPQIADPQSLIFSPPYLLLAAVDAAPSLRAADATLLLAVLAGAAALLLWFRDQGWHPVGGLLAAVAFAFGAAMAWRIQHVGQVLSMSYVPIVMLLLGRALDRPSPAFGAAAGVVAGFMVLGRDQVALLGLYLLAGCVAWRWFTGEGLGRELRRSVRPLAAGALGGLAIIAIPVLLTIAVTAESNRPAVDFIGAGRGSLHPALLLTLFAPDVFGSSGPMEDYWGPPSMTWTGTDLYIAQNVGQLYIGAVPALLLLSGLFAGILFRREIRFFTAAVGVLLLYALGWYTPAFRLMHLLLPGVDLFRRPADAVFPIGFLLAILAGYTLHRLLEEARRPDRWPLLATAGVVAAAFAAAIALALHFDRFDRALGPLAVSALSFAGGALVLAAALRTPRLPWALPALVAVTVLDLAWSNGPGSATALPPESYGVLEPSSRNETIALLKERVKSAASPVRRDRVELVGLGFHWPNASLVHRLENTLGYNPLRLGLYSRATGAQDHVGLPEQRKFSALFPSYRSTLADLLGLRYIAAGTPIENIDPSLRAGDLPLIARTRDAYIYENRRAFPRVLFATAAQKADFARMLEDGVWPDVDLLHTVLLEEPGDEAAERPPGSVRLARYRNTEVVVEAESPAGGWVVLNDVWQPWWRASVDGAPAPLLRANVLFRAVAVPGGRHRVRFSFEPVAGVLSEVLSRRGG